MSERKIKSAVLGYGASFGMGKAHAQWMNDTGRMETIAMCDIDATRCEAALKDYPGIKTYPCIEDMLAKTDAELVVVITPHNTHYDLAMQALNAGKSVVLEKPMCITVEQATNMIEAAKKNKVMLTTFHNRRHDGDFKAIKEVIDKGTIGDVFQIEAFMGGYNHPGTWWRSKKDISGGAMYDWGAHFVDWILNFMEGQEMESITGFFQKLVWNDVTNEDQTQAIIRFKNGATADLTMSSIAMTGKPRFRILGTKGAILDSWGGSFKVTTMVDGIKFEGDVKYKEGTWPLYYKNLAAHMLDGTPIEVTPESSRRVIAVIETAEKSSKAGKTLPAPVV
jgi:scyllo-inositol 2-dehydrogenase (NADP+)